MKPPGFLFAPIVGLLICLPQPSVAGKPAIPQDHQTSMLVSSSWLAEHLEDPSLIIIHVAQRRREYTNGHIPGARFLWSQSLTYTDPDVSTEFPPDAQADSTFRDLGVAADASIVIYFGESNVTPATRVYMTFDHYGLADRVSFLDGGLEAWKSEGRPLSKEAAVPTRSKVALHPKVVTVDWKWVRDNLENPKVSIIDARGAQFYAGNGGGMPRPGHIPNASNIPFSSVVDSTNKFKDAATLRKIFESAGIKPGNTVVSYCHVGQQATVIFFVAKYLGYDARMYDGSFEDWSSRLDLPVVNPSAHDVGKK